MASSRRTFLRQAGCALLGGAALSSGMEHFGLLNVLAQGAPASDYKALICIFLNGGNDGNNTVVPLDAEYTAYHNVRGAAGLALPQSDLLSISPLSGRTFGFNPSMAGMQTLFNQQKLAVVCNVGPLVEPLTRTTFLNGSGRRPYQLFSHSDQTEQWQTAMSDAGSSGESVYRTGWGGRVADKAATLNGTATLPQIVSINAASMFTVGNNSQPLIIPDSITPLNQALPFRMSGTPGEVSVRRAAYDQLRQLNREMELVKAVDEINDRALASGANLATVPFTSLPPFPPSQLGRQLQQIARVIQLRDVIGAKRQIFFCGINGFDTHDNQMISNNHANLLLDVNNSMKAFYDSTVFMGVENQVTSFTLSDFGRTLQPSGQHGSVGSDHAWGNHHLIMGGAVRGGDFYGRFPTLALNGPDDADGRGRWIPTTSVEQYAATLASWYGVSNSDLSLVFPFIGRFNTPNLGFMR